MKPQCNPCCCVRQDGVQYTCCFWGGYIKGLAFETSSYYPEQVTSACTLCYCKHPQGWFCIPPCIVGKTNKQEQLTCCVFPCGVRWSKEGLCLGGVYATCPQKYQCCLGCYQEDMNRHCGCVPCGFWDETQHDRCICPLFCCSQSGCCRYIESRYPSTYWRICLPCFAGDTCCCCGMGSTKDCYMCLPLGYFEFRRKYSCWSFTKGQHTYTWVGGAPYCCICKNTETRTLHYVTLLGIYQGNPPLRPDMVMEPR